MTAPSSDYSSTPAAQDSSPHPDELKALLRRYRSVGQAVVANDVSAATALMGMLSSALPQEQLDRLFWSNTDKATPEMGRWLIAQGANPQVVFEEEDYGKMPAAHGAAVSDNAHLLAALIDDGIWSADQRDHTGLSLVAAALEGRSYEAADVLKARGANIDITDLQELTPLHRAAIGYEVGTLMWLLRHGADPTVKTINDLYASELLLPDDSAPEFHPSVMFDIMETYRENWEPGSTVTDFPQEVLDDLQMEVYGPEGPPVPPKASAITTLTTTRTERADDSQPMGQADSQTANQVPTNRSRARPRGP